MVSCTAFSTLMDAHRPHFRARRDHARLDRPQRPRYKRGVYEGCDRPRVVPVAVSRTGGLAVLLLPVVCLSSSVLLASGCTSAQSGIFAATWCPDDPANGDTVDDMEDADGVLCSRFPGVWYVNHSGSAVTMPDSGDTTPPTKMTDEFVNSARLTTTNMFPPGFSPTGRWAMHLMGSGFSSDQSGEAILGARFTVDLTLYSELTFWSRLDAGGADRIQLRVNFVTDATFDSKDHWGLTVDISPFWNTAPVSVAVESLTQALSSGSDPTARAAALSSTQAIEFSYQFFPEGGSGTNPSDFSLWIDDLRLKPVAQ